MFLHGPVRVLFADDDPVLGQIARAELGEAGYDVTIAADGVEAVSRLDQGLFHILLLDLNMPNLDGFDVLSHVRARPDLRETPVIVVTGREDMFAIDEAFDRGATSFVIKPIKWPLLSRQIRFVLRANHLERMVETARTILAYDEHQFASG